MADKEKEQALDAEEINRQEQKRRMLDRLTYSFYNSMQLFSKANGASEDKVEINLDKHMLTSPLLKEILVAEEENFKDFKKECPNGKYVFLCRDDNVVYNGQELDILAENVELIKKLYGCDLLFVSQISYRTSTKKLEELQAQRDKLQAEIKSIDDKESNSMSKYIELSTVKLKVEMLLSDLNLYLDTIKQRAKEKLPPTEEYEKIDVTETATHTFDEILYANKLLIEQAEKINSFEVKDENGVSRHLSPFEKYLVCFYFASSLIDYNSNGKTNAETRDLITILKTKQGCCVGYAAILKTMLSMVGINSCSIAVITNDNWQENHKQNLVEIDDDLYNIHGVFVADPTSCVAEPTGVCVPALSNAFLSLSDVNIDDYAFAVNGREILEFIGKSTLPMINYGEENRENYYFEHSKDKILTEFEKKARPLLQEFLSSHKFDSSERLRQRSISQKLDQDKNLYNIMMAQRERRNTIQRQIENSFNVHLERMKSYDNISDMVTELVNSAKSYAGQNKELSFSFLKDGKEITIEPEREHIEDFYRQLYLTFNSIAEKYNVDNKELLTAFLRFWKNCKWDQAQPPSMESILKVCDLEIFDELYSSSAKKLQQSGQNIDAKSFKDYILCKSKISDNIHKFANMVKMLNYISKSYNGKTEELIKLNRGMLQQKQELRSIEEKIKTLLKNPYLGKNIINGLNESLDFIQESYKSIDEAIFAINFFLENQSINDDERDG